MTVVNKVSILSLGDYFTPRRAECSVSRIAQFVVSGKQFNMNFLLLGIQSTVCVACVSLVKKLGIISFRSFDMKDAKAWFPISFLLVSVIYTGSKSLVSCDCAPSPGDLLFDMILAISKYTGVYDLQESNNYSHCTSLAI